MDHIVCKFGGSSAADSNGFRRIRAILEDDPRRRYVVLSAPGALDGGPKVTDLLDRAWREGVPGAASEAVVKRFHAIAAGLDIDPDDDAVRACLASAAAISRDHLLSRGEYLCARLFSRYADLPFADAASLVCFDAGGALEVPETLRRMAAIPAIHPRAVIPGFYGGAPDGRIVTLPRNGSDITGALAAAGTGACLYENWTDVPGLMTEDPAVNPRAKVIPVTDYPGMRRFALNGARVLHPDCLTPVERAGIPTRLRCTMAPDAPGTLIRA